MIFNYKGNEIILGRDGITVYTGNKKLLEGLEEEGYKVVLLETLEEFLNHNDIVLIDNKRKLLKKKIETLGKCVSCEKVRNNFYKIKMEVPTKRSYYTISSKVPFLEGEYYHLTGQIEEDSWYNSRARSNLEKTVGFLAFNFKVEKLKHIKLTETPETHDMPRYELHCHTVKSKRDAFITNEQIKKSFKTGKLETLAITNHGINNCFPQSIKDFTKGAEKVIPAVELYCIDDVALEREISIWEQDNQELFDKKEDLESLIETKQSLITKNKAILDAKSYAKGQAGVIRSENKEHNGIVRESKKELKEIEKQLKQLLLTKPNWGDAQRRHVTCLVKSKDSSFMYRGKEIAFNPGIYELNKAITEANTTYFAEPVIEKWMGKRPIVPLSYLKKMKETGHFIFGAACSLGFIGDAMIEFDEMRASKYIDVFDYVEVQPLRNNAYLLEEHHYPAYKTLEDLKSINRRMFDFAKKHNKKVCFTSDAHCIDEKDTFKRAIFKKAYFSMFETKNKEPNFKKVLHGAREETQPFLHSYEQMMLELELQGFTEEERNWMYANEKEIGESCCYFNNATIIPKQMFVPDFPGIDVKTEVPKIAWENAKKMYGENMPKEIKTQLEFELDKINDKDYEFIYYVSMKVIEESEKDGYPVGSRGSVGSSLLAMFMNITKNNPLPPHYHCTKCHEHEWVEDVPSGVDLEDKLCPKCGAEMYHDGFNGQFTSFLGKNCDKIPDIDLNFSGDVQTKAQNKIIEWMDGKAWGSATIRSMKPDYLKQNVLSKYPNIEQTIEDEIDDEGNVFDFNYLAESVTGVCDGFGRHAGGIVALGDKLKTDDGTIIDVNMISPLVYPGDKTGASLAVMHEYHIIEENLLKFDLLGHGAPGTLKNLRDLSGVDPFDKQVRLNDPKIYEVLNDISKVAVDPDIEQALKDHNPSKTGNLGLPELSTDFLGQMITALNPEKFSDIVRINGLSHKLAKSVRYK